MVGAEQSTPLASPGATETSDLKRTPVDTPTFVATWAEIATYGPRWLARKLLLQTPAQPEPEEVDLNVLHGEARVQEITRRQARVCNRLCVVSNLVYIFTENINTHMAFPEA